MRDIKDTYRQHKDEGVAHMASGARDLIVDDDYFNQLARFFGARRDLENMLDAYLAALKDARTSALKSGEAADALDDFIGYVERLKGKGREISADLQDLAYDYVRAIDAADNYLF